MKNRITTLVQNAVLWFFLNELDDIMPQPEKLPRSLIFFLLTASLVITVAGIKAAAPILIPFLLSVFIAIVCWPLLYWQQKRGVPDILSIFVIVILTGVVGVGLVRFVGSSVNDFVQALPSYQEQLQKKTGAIIQWIEGFGVEFPGGAIFEYFNPAAAMKMVAAMLGSLGGVLTNSFLIFLTVVLMLLEASALPFKMKVAWNNPDADFVHFNKFLDGVKNYLAIKTLISLVTGILVSLWLLLNGIDFPFLWGVLAFMLNFVPNIGSFIAAAPPVLLGVIQYGFREAGVTILGYVAVNLVMGNIVEPRFMGRGLGLSTLIVFLSLVFWGWVLGPVGMLLSVPLTMIVKIALESHEDTVWIALLMDQEKSAKKMVSESSGNQ